MKEWFQIIFGLAILAAIALLSLGMVCAGIKFWLGKTMEQKMELALDKMLSKEQVAEIFGIKPKTVYTWVANGKLSKPDVISTRYSRFPLSRVKQDYFRQFGRDLILKE